MKKILILLLVLLPVLLSAYEHTGGARLDLNLEAPDIYGTIAEGSSTNRGGLWYEAKVNDLVHISADGGLVYEAYAGVAADLNKKPAYLGIENEFYPDIRSLNVFGYWGIFNYRAGRQPWSDSSGILVSQPLDAIDSSLQLGSGTLKAAVAYSGLVHHKTSNITMTTNDLDGSKRLIEGISYFYPELAGPYLNLNAGLTAQQDFSSEKMNSLYLQIGADGFLLPYLMYKSDVIYQIGKYDKLQSNGYLSDLQLFFVPEGRKSYVSLSAFLSSGESWKNRPDFYGEGASGNQNIFVPISTAASKGYVLSLSPGNLSAYELLVSLSKSRKFAFELSTTTLMRTVDGPVSSNMIIDDGESSLFIGQEGLMNFKFRPSSDFGASIKAGVLYPGESITINEALEQYLPVLPRLGIDLSFSL